MFGVFGVGGESVGEGFHGGGVECGVCCGAVGECAVVVPYVLCLPP